MSKPLKAFAIVFAILIGSGFSPPSFSDVYEKVLTKKNYHLDRWKMPLVRLVVKDAKSHPIDPSLVSIDANVIEIIRRGDLQLRNGPITAQWRTYRKMSPVTPDSRESRELVDDELFALLIDSSLICFIGSIPEAIILYADGCFLDNVENRETAINFAKSKPISKHLYDYAWLCILLFPPIGFILTLALPRIGMTVAALSFPAGVYILSAGRDYDTLIVYPALILAGIVTAFGFSRWLHQMVKEEQKEKASARQHDASNSD